MVRSRAVVWRFDVIISHSWATHHLLHSTSRGSLRGQRVSRVASEKVPSFVRQLLPESFDFVFLCLTPGEEENHQHPPEEDEDEEDESEWQEQL